MIALVVIALCLAVAALAAVAVLIIIGLSMVSDLNRRIAELEDAPQPAGLNELMMPGRPELPRPPTSLYDRRP